MSAFTPEEYNAAIQEGEEMRASYQDEVDRQKRAREEAFQHNGNRASYPSMALRWAINALIQESGAQLTVLKQAWMDAHEADELRFCDDSLGDCEHMPELENYLGCGCCGYPCTHPDVP